MAGWNSTIEIKDLLDHEDVSREQAEKLGKDMATRLSNPKYAADRQLQRVITRFNTDCFSQADFNDILNDMYDWADSRRVWVE
jgi:hypothetical protein